MLCKHFHKGLGSNQIGDDGATKIGEALKYNKSLLQISIVIQNIYILTKLEIKELSKYLLEYCLMEKMVEN